MIKEHKKRISLDLIHKKEYKVFFILMLVSGVASSASVPLISLFLVRELHIEASTASLYFLTALAWPAVSICLGHFSDRMRSRIPLIRFSVIWLGIGWVILAIATQFWQVLSIGILFFCFTGTLSAQTFATIHDILLRDGDKNENTVIGTIRAAYSLGWIIGPIIGSTIAALIGIRITFLITAMLYMISLFILKFLKNIPVQTSTSSQRSLKVGGVSGKFFQLVA
jgi:SET family sugar efflux transporter-like MFS transporter